MNVLVDVGANHGLYTDANINKFSHFILVEANPLLYQELIEKYKSFPNITVIHAIASNKPSETFYVSNADQISTVDTDWITKSRFSKNYTWRPLHGIKTIPLDKIVELFPTIERIKIDVEGYEYNVLQSLHKKVPTLCFEWAEEKKEELLLSIQYVKDLGYQYFHVQYEDKYAYEVPSDQWVDFNTLHHLLDTTCQMDRKEKWGMIWAT
jgi:FkbM family methyltransferase